LAGKVDPPQVDPHRRGRLVSSPVTRVLLEQVLGCTTWHWHGVIVPHSHGHSGPAHSQLPSYNLLIPTAEVILALDSGLLSPHPASHCCCRRRRSRCRSRLGRLRLLQQLCLHCLCAASASAAAPAPAAKPALLLHPTRCDFAGTVVRVGGWPPVALGGGSTVGGGSICGRESARFGARRGCAQNCLDCTILRVRCALRPCIYSAPGSGSRKPAKAGSASPPAHARTCPQPSGGEGARGGSGGSRVE
jgi:hypothetical protein